MQLSSIPKWMIGEESKDALRNISKILCKYADCSKTIECNGRTFINKIGIEDLSFLHKLFPRCTDEEIELLSKNYRVILPKEYAYFLMWSNGAILFDGTMFIKGIGCEVSRSFLIEDQNAVSLISDLELSRIGDGGWITLGLVSAKSRTFEIRSNSNGITRFGQKDCSFMEFPTFFSCLELVITILDNLTDRDGLRDPSAQELENEMLSLQISRRIDQNPWGH